MRPQRYAHKAHVTPAVPVFGQDRPMALTPQQLRQGFLVGDRLVQPALNRISGPEGEARLEPKVMAVLVCLAERAGEVVSRNTLYEAVWGQAVVTDQALTNCISELRHHLGDDRARPRFIETVPRRGYRLIAPVEPSGQAAGSPRRRALRGRPAALGYAVAGLLLVALIAMIVRPQPGAGRYEPLATVVALPFDNVAGDEAIDYLRLALPDEITTLLTQSPDLAVRPFEPGDTAGPSTAARERQARHLVTGHYYLEGDDRLAIAVEAQDGEHERLIWRARITVPADDLLAMRQTVAERVRRGLVPALGGSLEAEVPRPSDADAYRLYLHSLAISRDMRPNLQGIEMLEKVVRMDPAFAPAWAELASRYNYSATYGDGGADARSRSRDAATRALALDPGLVDAAQHLVVMETEAGELVAAYQRARELVDRRDRSGHAHFALAFVLRYAGMLEGAQRHCDVALALDPHFYGWRSCALAFMPGGKFDRAAEFIALDEGSYWSNLVGSYLRLREGDGSGALRYARALPPEGADRKFVVPCLERRAGEDLHEEAAAYAHRWRRLRDPEPAYHTAAVLAWCGRLEEALPMLRRAIDHGFCAHPALDSDPIWRPLRDNPEFQRLRQEAIACRERFQEAIGTAAASDAPPPG
jgi:DNA-binding winged helix-turn-helix (wHTH) protein/tetratricopeptide (TPR) repeat protein